MSQEISYLLNHSIRCIGRFAIKQTRKDSEVFAHTQISENLIQLSGHDLRRVDAVIREKLFDLALAQAGKSALIKTGLLEQIV